MTIGNSNKAYFFMFLILTMESTIVNAAERYTRITTMRCRSALISEGDSELRVIEKCGDPTYKNTISGGADIGERIEQWYYRGKGGRGKLHIITLQGGRVSKIELELFR